MGRTIIVGDVHGCAVELAALLEEVALTEDDRLVLAGDLVAKGPDSRGVVALARQRRALAVLGNHDAAVLAAAAGPRRTGHHADVARTLSEADREYLSGLPLWLDFPELNVVVVHGGLLPGTALEDQPRHVLLNLRSFDARGKPSTRVEAEGVPWASTWPGPRLVVFGHDAVRGLQRHPHAVGLDTGCVYGGALTALVLPHHRLVSVPARAAYRPIDA